MFEKIENLMERLETLLFLSRDNLTIEELCKFYNLEYNEILETLELLKKNRKNSGINVKIENDVVYLVTNPLYGEDVQKFFNPETKIKRLSSSTMETLAIIAYKGPITKGEIEKIRGVGVDKIISNLVEKKLIYISGKKKTIGMPNLYEVTEDFYSYLEIEKKEDLPNYSEFEQMDLQYYENDENINSVEDVENLVSIKNKLNEKIEVKKDEIE